MRTRSPSLAPFYTRPCAPPFRFDGDNAASVEVHVVAFEARAAAGVDDDDDGEAWSVARLEAYASALHSAEMSASHVRGSDALLDNHFGRRLGNSGASLDGLVARLNASAAPFRLWRQTNNNTSPPSDSMSKPSVVNSDATRATSAPSLSILLNATMTGFPACFAAARESLV